MLNEHCVALGSTYHCGCLVSVGKVGSIFTGGFLYVGLTVCRACFHCHEGGHAVAAVHVQQLACRAHAVGGIDVAFVASVIVHTPVLVIIRPELFKIVDV